MAWRLAYDISSPYRWQKVYRLARADGVWLQYSLFYVERPTFVIDRLYREIGAVIDGWEDDVRFTCCPTERRRCWRADELAARHQQPDSRPVAAKTLATRVSNAHPLLARHWLKCL
jgi:CRISPR/Cas system-associated endoribonuclease Cas2